MAKKDSQAIAELLPLRRSQADVREALGVPEDVPMITTDARDRASTKVALLELVQHALVRASAGAA